MSHNFKDNIYYAFDDNPFDITNMFKLNGITTSDAVGKAHFSYEDFSHVSNNWRKFSLLDMFNISGFHYLDWIPHFHGMSHMDKILGISASLDEQYKEVNTYIHYHYPLERKYLTHISKFGWPYISQQRPLAYEMVERTNMTQSELNNIFIHILSKNGYCLLIQNINELIDDLDNGHDLQLKIIKKLILSGDILNNKYYVLCFDTLFTILDYIYISSARKKMHIDEKRNPHQRGPKDKVLDDNIFSSRRKTFNRQLRKYPDFSSMLKLNEALVMSDLYKPIRWNNYKYDNIPYGRNSVVHGMYDPNKLTYTKFLQLILVCHNFAEDLIYFGN